MLHSAILDALQDAYALAQRLAAEAADWREKECHTAPFAARSLAKLSALAVDQVKAELSTLFREVGEGHEVDVEAVQVRKRRIVAAYKVLEVAQRSAHRSLHPVLSPTVRHLLNEFGVAGQVLVTSEPSLACYEIDSWSKDRFSQYVHEDDLRKVTLPFLIFFVPKPPLDWPMHLCLLYHEVGHAVYAHRRLRETMAPPFQEEVASDPLEQVRQRTKEVQWLSITGNWVEEVYADIFGLLAVGPAYFHSFCRTLCVDLSRSDCTPDHPPLDLRMRLMSNLMESEGFIDHLPSPVSELISEWRQEQCSEPYRMTNADIRSVPAAGDMAIAVEGLAQEVTKSVLAVLGEGRFSPAIGEQDLERAKQIALWNIAAIEKGGVPDLEGPGDPLPTARIFSSNWLAYYLSLKELDNVDRVSLMKVHGERLLHSLDAAAALREWRTD